VHNLFAAASKALDYPDAWVPETVGPGGSLTVAASMT
jgi:hypothetical protein